MDKALSFMFLLFESDHRDKEDIACVYETQDMLADLLGKALPKPQSIKVEGGNRAGDANK